MEEMVKMRFDGHTVDTATVFVWLKTAKKENPELEQWTSIELARIVDCVPTITGFPSYLRTLELMAKKRWAKQEAARLAELADGDQVTDETLRAGLDAFFDRAERQERSGEALLDIITPAQAREYKADPADFLVGDGLIMRGFFVTIGGEPGVGKSRLATTLAVAGARGNATWQGYPVKSKWRTLILQTENQGLRLKEEYTAIPAAYNDHIRVSRSLPNGLAFNSPEFRRELIQFYDKWPFQMIVLDPWNDVSAEDKQADYKEALQNIRRCFVGRPSPTVVIVAHLRKPRGDASGRRKTGRDLLNELSGSLALGSTSRSVFTIQAGSPSMSDDRIVFEISKANDCSPDWLQEYGTRSAWHRANGAFEVCKDFDWEDWESPSQEKRRSLDASMIRDAFNSMVRDSAEGAKAFKAESLARTTSELFDIGKSTVHRAISEGGYLADLFERDNGYLRLKKV